MIILNCWWVDTLMCIGQCRTIVPRCHCPVRWIVLSIIGRIEPNYAVSKVTWISITRNDFQRDGWINLRLKKKKNQNPTALSVSFGFQDQILIKFLGSAYAQCRLSSLRNSLRNRLRASFRGHSRGTRRSPAVVTGQVQDTSVRVQLNSVSQIDRVSRVIFPLAFIGMNFIYWYIYLRAERNYDQQKLKLNWLIIK